MKQVTLAVIAILATSCGYSTGGRADLLPKTIHTIAIPACTNNTNTYRLTDRLAQAISREFITRTRYRVIPDPTGADAILHCSVNNYTAAATVFDPSTGRASAVDIHVAIQVSLVDRETNKLLFSRPNMDVRERYQISVDPTAFFEESEPAVERASQQTARQVVSAILENF